jgi:hypothetical protein
MKIHALVQVSKVIDLDLFYVVSIRGRVVDLQGHANNEVIASTKGLTSLTFVDENWLKGTFTLNDGPAEIVVNVTLTF